MKRFYLFLFSTLIYIGVQAEEMQYFDFLKELHKEVSRYVFNEPIYVFPNGDSLLYFEDDFHLSYQNRHTFMSYARVVYKDRGIYEGLLYGLYLSDLVRLNYVPEDAWAWGTFYDFKTQQSIPCVFGLIEDKTDFSKLQSGRYFRPEDGDIRYFDGRYYWYPFPYDLKGKYEDVIYKLEAKAKTITVIEKFSTGYGVDRWKYEGLKKNSNGTKSKFVTPGFRGGFTMIAEQTNTRVSQLVATGSALKPKIISNSCSDISFTPYLKEKNQDICWYFPQTAEFNSEMLDAVLDQAQRDINTNTCLDNEISTGKADARKKFTTWRNVTNEPCLFKEMNLYSHGCLLIMRDMNADKWTSKAYRFLLSKDFLKDEVIHSGYSQSETSINGYDYVDMGLPSGNLWASNFQYPISYPYGSRIYETVYGKDRKSMIYKIIEEKHPGEELYYWGEINHVLTENAKFRNPVSDNYLLYHKFDTIPRKYDYVTNKMGSPWHCPSKKDWEELFQYSTIIHDPDEEEKVFVVGPNGNVLLLHKRTHCTNDVNYLVKFEDEWGFYPVDYEPRGIIRPVCNKRLSAEEVLQRKAMIENKPDPHEAYRIYKENFDKEQRKINAVVNKCVFLEDSAIIYTEKEHLKAVSMPLFNRLHSEAGDHIAFFTSSEQDMKDFLEPICYDYSDNRYTSSRYNEAVSFLKKLSKMNIDTISLRAVPENYVLILDVELSLPNKNPKKPAKHYKTSANIITRLVRKGNGKMVASDVPNAGKFSIVDLMKNLEEK